MLKHECVTLSSVNCAQDMSISAHDLSEISTIAQDINSYILPSATSMTLTPVTKTFPLLVSLINPHINTSMSTVPMYLLTNLITTQKTPKTAIANMCIPRSTICVIVDLTKTIPIKINLLTKKQFLFFIL